MTQHTPRIDLPTDQLAHQLNIDWESARLIRRALESHDDLLAALKETVECWGWNPDVKPAFWDNFELVPSELAYRKRVSAAIAKAEEGS